MRVLISSAFRLCSFGLFVFMCTSLHSYVLGHVDYSLSSFSLLSIYMTFLVLVLQIIYYILAAPLQLMRFSSAHGVLICVTMSLALLVCIMFWALFLYDKGLLIADPSTRVFPMWLHHGTHSAGICTNIIDVFLWKPVSVPFVPSLIMLLSFSGGYIYLLEHLIRVKKVYAYPVLAKLSESGRHLFYGTAVLICAVCFFISYFYIRSFVRTKKSRGTIKSGSNKVAPPAGKQKKARKAE